MFFRKLNLHILFLFFVCNTISAVVPDRIGWWKFDNANLLSKAESGFGNNLTLVGVNYASTGPAAGNGSVLMPQGSYYKMQHGIAPNRGATKVNEYTLQVDFKIASIGAWYSFYQTNLANTDDAEFFINKTGNLGVGAVGYTGATIIPNDWYRLVISVKNGTNFTCYLDGQTILSGNVQPVDGRFSLAEQLLIFADNDGEDGSIYCAELAIWDKSLNANEVKELGGFGHILKTYVMTRIPYLQANSTHSMTVSWHDETIDGTKIEFGFDSLNLNQYVFGNSELISESYRWHTVKLTNLLPNTRYFYRVGNGTDFSNLYAFKTLPDESYTGKLRFLLLSDTHNSDTTKAARVLKAAKEKILELYGANIEKHINGIYHSGDIVVSGNVVEQYSTQYFKPLSLLSPYIPTMVVAGNHEEENAIFYQYLKINEHSVFPLNPALNEKIWLQRIGNSVFIGLNSNISTQYGNVQFVWLDNKLSEIENDPNIDFVFLFFHHLPYSELWNVSDIAINYVKNSLLPVIKKYSKVQQLHYGHTHGFERGTILSEKKDADFRIICGGGGGGAVDPWYSSLNKDYNEIHKTLNHNFFILLEINPANRSYQGSMYSLGNANDHRNAERMDLWYKKLNQSNPGTPIVENAIVGGNTIQFNISAFTGVDSLMSVHYQVIVNELNKIVVADTLLHWQNVFGVDNAGKPFDKNLHIDLNKIIINKSRLNANMNYLFRVRFRDHNLKWSEWSTSILFNTNGIVGIRHITDNNPEIIIIQNYPNPFQQNTLFRYNVNELTEISIRIYDLSYRLMATISEGMKPIGQHQVTYNSKGLIPGMYLVELRTKNAIFTTKIMKLPTN